MNFEEDQIKTDLKSIGFWATSNYPEQKFPNVLDHVDEKWDSQERNLVLLYLKKAPVLRRYRGMSVCRICRCANGNGEQSDGVYLWPTGLSHYVEQHQVKLPSDFIYHVKCRS